MFNVFMLNNQIRALFLAMETTLTEFRTSKVQLESKSSDLYLDFKNAKTCGSSNHPY